MSLDNYIDAYREGLREVRKLKAEGKDPGLPVLAELEPEYTRLSQVPLGIVQIAVSQIAGTATKGRTTAFSRGFYPLLEPGTEFSNKWAILYDGMLEDGLRQPVTALEYYGQYYIVEGNKRVSVTRLLGSPFIEADVTRILPEPEDTPRYRLYREYVQFYEDTRIGFLLFSREGSYARLCELAGHEPGQKWEAETVFDLQSCYFRFEQAYTEHFKDNPPVPAGDALLVDLEIFGFSDSIDKTPAEHAKDIARIESEFRVAASGKPAVLLSHASEEKPGLLQSVLHPRPSLLRCAFLYNSTPERSGWTYWHELGREAIAKAFGTRVETTFCSDVSAEEAAGVMEEWIADGIDVIFAASPVFLEACIRESALHPETKILNCSLLASYHNVRSYYLRIYEAKFILGMIAGAMAEDDRIGYIADYPIYGVPASINAFALGAQTSNPRARVFLEWSTLRDHNPEEALAAQGITLISNRDIRAPLLENRSFGLYRVEGETLRNLAMPVWNWSRLYESVIRSILNGAFTGEGEVNADRAMNYYMGMSTDAIDLLLSEKLPAGVRRLSELLHAGIRHGDFHPFVGPIVDQSGTVRLAKDEVLSRQAIIGMDYLVQNVQGAFPAASELNDAAQRLVKLQGVKAAKPVPTD